MAGELTDEINTLVAQLPTRATLRAEAQLNKSAAALADGYEQHGDSWFRPMAYAFLSHCIDVDLMHLLYPRLQKFGRYKYGQIGSANRFQVGLMAILAERIQRLEGGSRKRGEKRTRNDLARSENKHRLELGLLMWHAYRHYITPGELNGFSARVRNLDKATSEQIEDGFEDFIIARRSSDLGRDRGVYPRHIEEGVREFRASPKDDVARALRAIAEAYSPDEFEAVGRLINSKLLGD